MVVPVRSAIDQVGLAQDREVPGHRRPGQLELGGQLAGGHVALPEQREDAPPGRIGEGLVDAVDFGVPLIRRTTKLLRRRRGRQRRRRRIPAARLGGDAEGTPTPSFDAGGSTR